MLPLTVCTFTRRTRSSPPEGSLSGCSPEVVRPDTVERSSHTRLPLRTPTATWPEVDLQVTSPAVASRTVMLPDAVAAFTRSPAQPMSIAPDADLAVHCSLARATRRSPDALLREATPPTVPMATLPLAESALQLPSTCSMDTAPLAVRTSAWPSTPLV